MGVFAWFRRKGEKDEATAGATPEEAAGTALTDGSQERAEGPSDGAGTPEGAEAPTAGTDPAEPASCGVTSGADATGEAASDGAAPGESADGVDIPKQQSAGKAADNEAGEGART
ncbi:hypothetical protein [Streptomyces sp. DH12]|uniref:hypothetical protein n=1 Tax=Streptomyces sp. DH12 TaxID=2857010 RepID=UPI001E4DD7D2|nr:hypothetical protein [Streptomyces sp. DH12]